jgi:hypothetical protein
MQLPFAKRIFIFVLNGRLFSDAVSIKENIYNEGRLEETA